MTAVQESEILNDDLIIPAVELFPVSHEKENVVGLDPIPDPERETEGPFSSTPPHIPTRSWLRFRRSSGSPSPRRKDRSRSPPSKSQSSDVNVDDQTATARPEVSRNATEAIEVTISIPSPLDSTEDSISPLAEKSTMNARSSSSWFNFRRSLKSSGSCKNLGSSPCLSAKSPDFPNRESIPSLVPSTTEKTAGTDDEWLQEVMSLSTAGGDVGDLSPWLPESGQKEMKGEKSSNSSRLFSFKWTKPSNSVNKVEEININDILDNPVGNSWATESNSSFLWNNSGDANEFHNRHRLSTESTIQSVVTEVHEEEELADGSDFAQQSFNFLKI